MDELVPSHWLYPIRPGSGHYFIDDDGNPILDPITGDWDTSAAAFWESVAPDGADSWYLATGYKSMRPDDLVWVYCGVPLQSIIGLGRAASVFQDNQGQWFVNIVWDIKATAKLQAEPIPRTEFGDIAQAPARRPSRRARGVLEEWLKHHRLDSRLNAASADGEALAQADARQRVLAEVIRRQGQPTFRNELLRAYAGKCAVSGCAVPEVLEAAHIRPYNGPRTNRLSNGLLLRSDIHLLFDRHLIGVDANDKIVVHPKVPSPYRSLHGKTLNLPDRPQDHPSRRLLAQHLTAMPR